MDTKIAIVGMSAIYGLDEGLDAFDRTLYDGFQHSQALPENQEKKKRKKAKHEYKEACFSRFSDAERSSVKVLVEKAIDGALEDAISKKGENIWDELALILLTDRELPPLERHPKRMIMADSLPRALQTAQTLLAKQEEKAIIIAAVHLEKVLAGQGISKYSAAPGVDHTINGLTVGQGVGAVYLKRQADAVQAEDRIYAVIDSIVFEPNQPSEDFPSRQMIADGCRKALAIAGTDTEHIAYLEIFSKGIDHDDARELEGLSDVYSTGIEGLTCALGCVKDNIGEPGNSLSLAGLIKTAWCLYLRYIPAVPQWSAPQRKDLFEKSPFYLPTESRPWFLPAKGTKRSGALSHVDSEGASHIILSNDEVARTLRPNQYLPTVAPYCFPLAGNTQNDLIQQLQMFSQIIETTVSLRNTGRENWEDYKTRAHEKYALMLVGHTKEELKKEAQFMLKGLPAAFEKAGEIKLPKGSYFTANPLGNTGKVAFVYPGVGSTYIGLGQHVFHLFPEIYYPFSLLTPSIGELLMDTLLYPRSRERLTEDQLWKMELGLRKYFMAISKSGIGFFVINTMILKDIFEVYPHQAIGYSMGEPGMMASLDVWHDPGQLVDKTFDSPTFMKRLHGDLEVLQEYWQMDTTRKGPDDKFWDCYTLQATPQVVEEAIKDEPRVFLTIINTPEEVVIAGDPEGCLRAIKKLDCKYYPLSLDLIIHCEPTRLEYDRLADLFTLPTKKNPGIKFYSSSYYKPLPTESKVIGQSIAKAFCEIVDFPRLVGQAYDDGARIFVEVGSRKFCCNLIDKILKGKDHLATPINVKGTTDQISIVRVLAQLVSHRVPVNLSPLL